MKIERDVAVELFNALGLTSAGRRDNIWIADKLATLDDFMDEAVTIEDEGLSIVMERVLQAIKDGETFEVLGGEVEVETEESEGGQESVSYEEYLKVKAELEALKRSSKRPKRGRRRVRAAGACLRKNGMTESNYIEITDDMIEYVNVETGRPNDQQSRNDLENAWSALVGYFTVTE